MSPDLIVAAVIMLITVCAAVIVVLCSVSDRDVAYVRRQRSRSRRRREREQIARELHRRRLRSLRG